MSSEDESSSEKSEERVRLLALVDIFEPLSEEEIKRLNGQLSVIHLEPGQIFYTPPLTLLSGAML